MEAPLTHRIRNTAAAFLAEAAGAPVAPARVKPSAYAPLSCSAFVRDGMAGTLLPRIREGLARCTLDGVPLLGDVTERGGWLLLDFSDAWWERLCALAKALPMADGGGGYLENRLRMLVRHGDAPCPIDATVRRVLWLAWLAHDAGGFSAETGRAVLTMTHHLTGMQRVRLEHGCGGVAAAILHLKGDSPCS